MQEARGLLSMKVIKLSAEYLGRNSQREWGMLKSLRSEVILIIVHKRV